MPLFSSVAVCAARAVFRLPVGVKVPVAGSYSSALAKALPSGVSAARHQHHAVVQQRRRVRSRAVFRLPVGGEGPGGGIVQLRTG